MLHIKLITVGTLKEKYLKEAVAEYEKRLGAYAKVEILELKEARVAEDPAPAEIRAVLEKEADAILAAIPPRAYTVALCVEGQMRSSEQLAALLEGAMSQSSELCLVIGSSHGLAPRVKAAANYRLSVSALTFPHQLMRVLLLETVYRSLSILHGSKYHK
ncbi:MAG: 23S rRNA (pseudouridine(1915)-N(3))-methyltransferase RlmH [Clostridia bacterium]|nr:23S rRNA (pseudouridine(1915)-N(3))-methyltransferase RlmH [Clostridia bacterium]